MPQDKKPIARGNATMDITPLNPNSAPIGGPGQPILRDGAIPPPYPQGAAPLTIAPIDPTHGDARAIPVPVRPGAWQRPGFSGITRI